MESILLHICSVLHAIYAEWKSKMYAGLIITAVVLLHKEQIIFFLDWFDLRRTSTTTLNWLIWSVFQFINPALVFFVYN